MAARNSLTGGPAFHLAGTTYIVGCTILRAHQSAVRREVNYSIGGANSYEDVS